MASVEQLLSVLGRQVTVRAGELAPQLGVSQPTLSRLITAAGDRVLRMGRGRATHYARTRSLPALGTRLPIHQVDETGHVRPYGVLHLLTAGRHWLESETGEGELFEGLPPFAADLSPQGYVGRSFSSRYPELDLPVRITDWSDDHRLIALARRGEDCVGDLILGDESLNRFLEMEPRSAHRDSYPELARASMAGQPGSSAGGEQPKFLTYAEGRHVLVKFAGGDDGTTARRWRDLLTCEHLALEAVRAAGIPAASASTLDLGDYRFLEVERCDRIGARGRKALLSLGAIDDEYFGHRDTWTRAARRMSEARLISEEDARRIRWLDTFGQLTGNTDRHFGNLSFFVEGPKQLRLAPVYDMLPMVFAPVATSVVDRTFEPRPPTADTLDVWPDAARHAVEYWTRLAREPVLGDALREHCARHGEAVSTLVQRAPV
ncbi:type II toxin-antitoxin system HipA family toxin YjjJ [Myxococcus sp. RHSTA-1-4]|uniref:type II toxin-antitoxin system HipA family toxin YjjJ n=1 Tax=Myxococcus sp. RHSTA-1-4 TaxID=2874601 RepID=UPI001CBCD684|nr:type II toxin-antitoxin system HipA family toxin YjjJ [Myxococcus sp. RHSTA-1-4]MBZ4421640.1 type II toxin-antitoxin system HipA family toxin YjjJ [Myxococcus sp. RHSTA-1-4]